MYPYIHNRGLHLWEHEGWWPGEQNTKSPFPGSYFHSQWPSGGAHSALLPERLEFQRPHCLPGAVPTNSAEIPRRLFSSQRFIIFVKF